jgi:hypothetical protein
MVLEVGPVLWPFPVPLLRTSLGWQFDIAEGREEILNRRIGRNELNVLRIMRAFVQAQREYANQDRDGDEVLEYAQKLGSSPGMTDGLYWSPTLNGELSPFGPLVAYAQAQGYSRSTGKAAGQAQPFHGYFFKILSGQGKHAPGGRYDYVINGNMIGGFAMVAWPAQYSESGIMTFVVNHQGRVYQRDLGDKTGRVAQSIHRYDPDKSWGLSRE